MCWGLCKICKSNVSLSNLECSIKEICMFQFKALKLKTRNSIEGKKFFRDSVILQKQTTSLMQAIQSRLDWSRLGDPESSPVGMSEASMDQPNATGRLQNLRQLCHFDLFSKLMKLQFMRLSVVLGIADNLHALHQ